MKKSRSVKKKLSGSIKELKTEDLVDIVRSKKHYKDDIKNEAYNEIENRIKVKITYISRQFYIPGLNFDDILQEALYALRFKAIIDYNKDKGTDGNFSPFDKFAILCIRRHLSTILKSSFQNKKKALNTSISIDQERGNNEDEKISLADIIIQKESSIIEEIGDKEYYKNLFSRLCIKLSKLEKIVFVLYTYKYSYDEITDKINKAYKNKNIKKKVDIKSIDNSISRIKQKAKEVFKKYEEK